MVIREGNNSLEIVAVDRVSETLPSAQDVELSVVVASHEFTGQGFACVQASRLATFVAQLRDLQERRQGAATLNGLSPGEFDLRIWSVNRRGHMAISGRIVHHIHRGEGGPYLHALSFGFEFDPTLLPGILQDFRAIAEGRAK